MGFPARNRRPSHRGGTIRYPNPLLPRAKTIPVRLGPHRASIICVVTLVIAMFFHFAVFWASPLAWSTLLLLGALGINVYLLLWPAFKLTEGQERRFAMDLFNKSSYYPLATLALILAQFIIA